MASKYLQSIPLPQQLPKVMDKLVKAVLRDQPKDIIKYCADYFSALQSKQLHASKPNLIDKTVLKSIQISYNKYFKKGENRVQKEEVIKFMRFYASQNQVRNQPIPNSIQDILLHLKGRTQFGKEEFIDTIAEYFSH